MTTKPISDHLRLGDLAPRVRLTALAVAVVALAASMLLGLLGDGWSHFLRAYTAAFMFVTMICLGALFFVFVQHATRAGWSVAVRRVAEAFAANFAWLWVLFVPVALSIWISDQYHWVHPAPDDHVLEHKRPYLNVPFWLIRAGIYFLVWGFLGVFFFRNSVAQDGSGDVARTHRMQAMAPAAAILFALTLTFAAVDWVMSLAPHWFSTIWGPYFFAASCCGYFSLQILVFSFLQRSGKVGAEVTPEHYQDLGKLLFSFGTVFWAYIGFSQYMLIWYANLPEETTWYLPRQLGGWKVVSLLLIVGHFVLPFLILITRHTKRWKPSLTAIAAWMLVMHYVDVYWLVMPHVPAELAEVDYAALEAQVASGAMDVGWHPQLVDVTLPIGLLALLVAATAHRLRGVALVPVGDPRLSESLAFENM
jgi:hypothetical protein